MLQDEIIRDIKGYEGLYVASSLGYVKSLPRGNRKGRILKPINDGKGYFRVHLSKDNHAKLPFIHQVIADTFPEICGEKFEGAEISHLDENPANNRADNLRYVNHTTNINHGTRTQKVKETFKEKGISKRVGRFTLEDVLDKEYESLMDAEREGFNHGAISLGCHGKMKAYKGYFWKFI